MTRLRPCLWILIACLALGCRSATEAPEAGAILLRLKLASGAAAPDELRVFVYDDSGVLWRNVRIPEQGTLQAKGGSLGTILIQPGETSGELRLHVVGRASGTRVVDGVLRVATTERLRGTFDLSLASEPLADGDGDAVPDVIDDCATAANPEQGGCPGSDGRDDAGMADGGGDSGGSTGTAGAGGSTGAGGMAGGGTTGAAGVGGTTGSAGRGGTTGTAGASGTTGTAGRGGTTGTAGASGTTGTAGRGGTTGTAGASGTTGTAGRGGTTGTAGASGTTGNAGAGGATDAGADTATKANGVACSAANECGSGFCKDGVCCNTACTTACNSCATGTCTEVTRMEDAPECVAPMRCNPAARCVLN